MKNKTEVTIKLPNGSALTEKQAREVYAKLDDLFGKPTTINFKQAPLIGPDIWPYVRPYQPYLLTPEPFPRLTYKDTTSDIPIYALEQ